MSDDPVRQLEDRVRALEAARRRDRWRLGAVVLAGAALALGLGARPPTSVVRAERFELVDGSGDEVGAWSAADHGLTLSGPGGEVALAADRRGGPSLTLTPRRGDGVVVSPEASPPTRPAPAPAPAAPPVVEPPAAADPTLRMAPVTLTLAEGSPAFSAMEIQCSEVGFRERAPFTEGSSTVPGVPADVRCLAFLKGGPPVKVQVTGGDDLTCTIVGSAAKCDRP